MKTTRQDIIKLIIKADATDEQLDAIIKILKCYINKQKEI